MKALENNPHVELVEPNYILELMAEPNDPSYSQLWGLENTGQAISGVTGTAGADIDAEAAWNVTTGSNAVVVGVVDTGVDYTHPDLAANMWTNPGGIGNAACAAGTFGFNASLHVQSAGRSRAWNARLGTITVRKQRRRRRGRELDGLDHGAEVPQRLRGRERSPMRSRHRLRDPGQDRRRNAACVEQLGRRFVLQALLDDQQGERERHIFRPRPATTAQQRHLSPPSVELRRRT
jgi:subtilisin family serine protease